MERGVTTLIKIYLKVRKGREGEKELGSKGGGGEVAAS
jgi:hypothetical protein